MLKILSQKIVKSLFMSGSGVATRLELKRGITVEKERSLGGLCRGAAEDRVYDILKRCLLDESFWTKKKAKSARDTTRGIQ